MVELGQSFLRVLYDKNLTALLQVVGNKFFSTIKSPKLENYLSFIKGLQNKTLSLEESWASISVTNYI